MKLQSSKPSNMTCLDHVGLKKISCGSDAHPGRSQDSQSACSGKVANDDAIRVISCCHHITRSFLLTDGFNPQVEKHQIVKLDLVTPNFCWVNSKQVNTFQQTKQTVCSTTRDVMIRQKSVTIFSMGLLRFSRAPWLPLSDVGRIINP